MSFVTSGIAFETGGPGFLYSRDAERVAGWYAAREKAIMAYVASGLGHDDPDSLPGLLGLPHIDCGTGRVSYPRQKLAPGASISFLYADKFRTLSGLNIKSIKSAGP